MNLILQVVIAIWLLCVVPFALGLLLEKTVIKEKYGLAECMTYGMIGVCSLFLIIAVPMIRSMKTLHFLSLIWSSVAGIITVGGIVAARQEIKDFLQRLHDGIRKKDRMFYVTVAICIVSIFAAVFFIQPGTSGNVVEITNRIVTTDSLYGYDAYTGEAVATVDRSLKYAPFEVYYAVISKLTGIHPAILIKTVISMIWITSSYCMYYMWGDFVYPSYEKKKCMFVLAGIFLSLYPVLSNKGYGLWVLNGIWQRDAFLCSYVMPVALFVCMSALQRKETILKTVFKLLLCAGAAELAIFKGFYYIIAMAFVTIILWLYRRWNRCSNA